MMKTISKITAVFALLFLLSSAVFATPDVTVTFNGEPVDCTLYGQNAIIVNDRTLVPLRAVFEAIGAEVEWDEPTRTVTSYREGNTVTLTIGEKILYKNGQAIPLDVASQIINDRTVVPVRAVAEAYGVNVDWDGETYTVILTGNDYYKGFVSDGVYYGKWAGVNYILPDEFDYYLSDELCEFMVEDIEGNSLYFDVNENVDGLSPEEYLKTAMSVYENVGVEYKLSEIGDVKIADIPMKSISAGLEYGKVKLNQSVAVFSKDEKLVCFTFTYSDEQTYKKMLSGFCEYKKPEAVPVFSDIPKKDATESAGNDENSATGEKQLVHAFGKLSLGMTRKQVSESVAGETEISDTYINIWDTDAVYSDEDTEIVGQDANCDFIHLEFDNDGCLESVYISTEYSTKDKAENIMRNVVEYYGNGYVTGSENAGFTWISESKTVSTEMIYETKNGMYYCVIYICK